MSTSLTFEFIGNACGIFTGSAGTRLLCDPWLVDGVFDGSWCHYPPLKTRPGDLRNIDALYISHLHPDHFDDRYFDFDRDIPILVLDDGPNFLIRSLNQLGYFNLIRVKSWQTVGFREFAVTLFAPFTTHVFHRAPVGNVIDSALRVECNNRSALNCNDNNPSTAAAQRLRETFGAPTLAMLNYNAAGPYPSCFDNLSLEEKHSEQARILERNYLHMGDVIRVLQPRHVLPFAGAYVLGGRLRDLNPYLGTATWDECADSLAGQDLGLSRVLLLREGDIFDLETDASSRPYIPIDRAEMRRYIADDLASIRYPYEVDDQPDEGTLVADMRKAADAQKERMRRYGISSSCSVTVSAFGRRYQIHPRFEEVSGSYCVEPRLECSLDERLLRRILDRRSHWNNAEIGAHISFIRTPNVYEPDLHTALQFFHV